MKSELFTIEDLKLSIQKYKNVYDVSVDLKCSANTVKNYLKKFELETPKGFYSNLSNKKVGRPKGRKCSENQKKILSEKFSGTGNPFFGKKHSELTKLKMKKNHADFSGNKNPFLKACKKNPKLIEQSSKIKENEWNKLSIEQRYERTKRVLIGDLSSGYWTRLISNAKTRSIDINITPEFIWDLFLKQDRKCALSNVDLNLKSCYEITASLDRIDSTKGYTIDNVQWIHKELNWLKNNINQDKFILWCNKVSKWQQSHHNLKKLAV